MRILFAPISELFGDSLYLHIFEIILGSFVGDFPDKDPKQACKVAEDCTNENETCQIMDQWGGFCGTEKCQSDSDCMDIGHVVYGIFNAKGCNDGFCEYWQEMLIA